jgi:hypothetical protein
MQVRSERRGADRRHGARMSERQMRCLRCGTVWYSRVAKTVAPWAQCVHCHGRMHTERRGGADRRH